MFKLNLSKILPDFSLYHLPEAAVWQPRFYYNTFTPSTIHIKDTHIFADLHILYYLCKPYFIGGV